MTHRRIATLATAVAAALSGCWPSTDPGVTVSGTVVSLRGGPIAGATVHVQGRPAAVTTVSGGFEISGVRVPYDVVAVATGDDGRTHVSVYEGLRALDPYVAVEVAAPASTATVDGTLEGYAYQAGDVTVGTVCTLNPVSSVFDVAPDGTFAAAATWESVGAMTLYALQYAPDGAGLPATYRGKWGYGTVDLWNGSVVSDLPLSSQPVTDVAVDAEYLQVPAGYSVVRAVPMTGSGRCAIVLPAVEAPPTRFSYLAPYTGTGDFTIAIVAEDAAGARVTSYIQYMLQLGDTALGVYLRPGLTQLSPAPGGALATSSTLAWDDAAAAGGLFVHRLVPSSGGGPAIRIATDGHHDGVASREVRLAALAAAGVVLPSGASYTWTVETAPASDVDGYARIVGVPSSDDLVPAAGAVAARSAPRTLVVP